MLNPARLALSACKRLIAKLRRSPAPIPPPITAALDTLAQAPSFVVVQLGAYIGNSDNDPLFNFLTHLPSSQPPSHQAILVEPVPRIFATLTQNYANQPGIQFANVAISDRDETKPFFFIDDPHHELPAWASEVGSFIHDLVTTEIAGRDVRSFIREIQVPCLTPASLLQQHQIQKVDVVVIDAQGYDDRILLQLPLSSIHPVMIIFEHCLLSDIQRQTCQTFLNQHGYQLESDRWDTLATLR
jgi:FkbM family methyltransferase